MQTFADSIRYRFVLANLVGKNFKTLYRNMALGFLWSVLQPLVLITVLTFVWVVFFETEHSFASSTLITLIPYNFFSYCLSGCTASIVGNASLVKKVSFPRQVLPFSVILTHLIHFAIQLPLLLAVLLLFPPPATVLGQQLLWLPVIFAVQLGLIVGVGLLVSSLNVVYRDVQYVVDSALVVAFWLCPILYDSAAKMAEQPVWQRVLYYLNPMAGILEGYRGVLYHGVSPDPIAFGVAVGVSLAVGAFGVRTFWVHEREFADLV